MNKRRLLKLADLLEADANNPQGVSFDLSAWVQKKKGEDFTRYGFSPGEVIPVSCGTAACAWGLAAICGAFADEGVSYMLDGETILPAFGGQTDFRAASAFFEIDEDEAGYLFDPDYYPTEKLKGRDGEIYVAARVRSLAEGKVTQADIDDANYNDD